MLFSSDILLSSLIQVALITSFITTIGASFAAIAQIFSEQSVAYIAFLQVMPQLYLLSVLITCRPTSTFRTIFFFSRTEFLFLYFSYFFLVNSRRRIKARVMTHINADGLVVGPTRRAHRASREKKADSLPYRSRNRPSVSLLLKIFLGYDVNNLFVQVQYGSGARADARAYGIAVDCESYQQIEILEKDSFYPEVVKILPPPVAVTSVNRGALPLHMDPLPYHSSFDALVIPRRLFDELEISIKHNVSGSALASHVDFSRDGRGSISADTIGTSNGTIASGNPGNGVRRGEGFKMYKPSTWSS